MFLNSCPKRYCEVLANSPFGTVARDIKTAPQKCHSRLYRYQIFPIPGTQPP